MNSELKNQIQENRPQCDCVESFGTYANPHNERCSICDEGESGVADKIAMATKLCVEHQRKMFRRFWDSELENFITELSKEHYEKISYLAVPYDVLDWLEEVEDAEVDFEYIGMNLRLQKDEDQIDMLIQIINRANEQLDELRQIENHKIKKRLIIKKKVCERE